MDRARELAGTRAAQRSALVGGAAIVVLGLVLLYATAATSTRTEFVQLSANGLALGALYALIALGFVIIYKATEVINFAHGAMMLFGTYVVFSLTAGLIPAWGTLKPFPSWLQWWMDMDIALRFVLAVAVAAVLTAGLGVLIERTVLRKMVGQPVFAVVLITLGLELVIATMVQILWNPQQKSLQSPFKITSNLTIGNATIQWAKLWTIIVVAVLVAGFFLFFRYTRAGVAMRATAFDQEAAMAMGIKASTIFAIAWGIAGGLAAIAGALFVPAQLAGFITLTPVRFAALNAFPAAILGGMDSPGGAVVGGVSIGLAQVYSARWLNPYFQDWNLPNFHIVFPFLLMFVVLMVRPYGLFGTREVRRV
jgi:branched-chain amino acid transport system permease protein